jgi:hypothetical protein
MRPPKRPRWHDLGAATVFTFTPRKLTLQPGMYGLVLVNRGKTPKRNVPGGATRPTSGNRHIVKTEAASGKTSRTQHTDEA